MTPDDSKLFRALNQDVEPLIQDKVAIKPSPNNDINPPIRRKAAVTDHKTDLNFLSDAPVNPVEPIQQLSYQIDGLQTGVFRRLKQGKYPIEAHLDLHRHTVAQARHALFNFIRQALLDECRLLLVTHGKGERSNPPARIKSYVNYWLKQFPQVMAFVSAQQKQGGTGSVYVLLKKSAGKSLENREHFS